MSPVRSASDRNVAALLVVVLAVVDLETEQARGLEPRDRRGRIAGAEGVGQDRHASCPEDQVDRLLGRKGLPGNVGRAGPP